MASIRNRLRIAALAGALISQLAASGASAADQLTASTKGVWRSRLADHTRLFEHYDRDTISDWTRIHNDLTELMVDKSSVKLAVFERRLEGGSRERRIVFLGTDPESLDLRYELAEYLPGFGLPQRAEAARQMYQQAIAWATGIVNQARREGVHIEVDGYSRGAQFATVVAGRLDVDAFNYNGMPLGLGHEFLDDQQQARAQRRVVNVYHRDDFARWFVKLADAALPGATYVVDPAPFNWRTILDYPHSPAGLRNALLGPGAIDQVVLLPRGDAQALAEHADRVAGAARRVARKLAAQKAGDAALSGARGLAETLDARARSMSRDAGTSKANDRVWIKAADRAALGSVTLAAQHIVGNHDLDRAVGKYLAQVQRPDSGPDRAAIQLYADVANNSLRRDVPLPGWAEVYGGQGADQLQRATSALRGQGVSDDGLRALQATQELVHRIASQPDERSRGFDRFVATAEEGQQITSSLAATAEALRELYKFKPRLGDKKMWKELGSTFSAHAELFGLATALGHDIDAMREHRWTVLRSEVIETVVGTLVTGSSIPGVDRTPLGSGLLPKFVATLRSHGVIAFRNRLESIPTFGALDLIGAVRDHALDQHISIETAGKYCDAAVGFTWGLLGLRVSNFNPNVASAFEAVGQASAAVLRASMRDTPVERAVLVVVDKDGLRFRDLAGHLIDRYSIDAESMVRAGKRPQDWTTYFGGSGPEREPAAIATLRGAGIEGETLRSLQRISDDYASLPLPRGPIAGSPVAPQTAPVAGDRSPAASPDPGGVDQTMRIDAGRFKPAPAR